MSLTDFIPWKLFRTTLSEYRHYPPGVSEIFVEIQLKEPFAKSLSFDVPWDGLMYGYVRGKKEIVEKLGDFSVIKLISLQDWDDRFLLLFENEDKSKEKPFFVSQDDVRELLENCRRVPEQASRKKKG